MFKGKNIWICLAIVLSLSLLGCVKLRDYFGVKEGAFGLDIKKGFGEGADKKDYYAIDNNVALVIRDTEAEVVQKIGLPDKFDTTLEGYKTWIYEERELVLFFKGDRLGGWSIYEPKEYKEKKKGFFETFFNRKKAK